MFLKFELNAMIYFHFNEWHLKRHQTLADMFLWEILQRASKEAAEKFRVESGLAPKGDIENLDERIKIRDAIQDGHIPEAIDLINRLHPELLDNNKHLYFHLLVMLIMFNCKKILPEMLEVEIYFCSPKWHRSDKDFRLIHDCWLWFWSVWFWLSNMNLWVKITKPLIFFHACSVRLLIEFQILVQWSTDDKFVLVLCTLDITMSRLVINLRFI